MDIGWPGKNESKKSCDYDENENVSECPPVFFGIHHTLIISYPYYIVLFFYDGLK